MMNVARQPNRAATGTTINGVTIAPNVPPLNDMAIPVARRLAGRDSTAVLSPPGNVAPSPSPSTKRAAANPMNADIQAWEALDSVHNPTASNIPARSPIKSRMDPHNGVPTLAKEEEERQIAEVLC